uniref:Cadherin domain-containing protein n=1 Tax=Poecilia mexicana TaxID=48701 RepID=A0A3B3YYC6_9TELE
MLESWLFVSPPICVLCMDQRLQLYDILEDFNKMSTAHPFAKAWFRYVLPEEMKRGSVIGNVALDLGLQASELQARRARVVAEGTSQLCELDTASGNLLVSQRIDREELCYNITVTATDSGSPSLSSVKVITILVNDVNDNPPTFTHSQYNVNILENQPMGTLVMKLEAQDSDDGTNAKIFYHISRETNSEVSSFLTINPDTGELFTSRLFDYEQSAHFQMKVAARDGGDPAFSTTCTVNVFIQDQNDNAPVILYPVQTSGSQECCSRR